MRLPWRPNEGWFFPTRCGATRGENASTRRGRRDVDILTFACHAAVENASRGHSSSSRRAGSGVGIVFRELVNPRTARAEETTGSRCARAADVTAARALAGGRDVNATHHLDGFPRTWMTPRTLRQLERGVQWTGRSSLDALSLVPSVGAEAGGRTPESGNREAKKKVDTR